MGTKPATSCASQTKDHDFHDKETFDNTSNPANKHKLQWWHFGLPPEDRGSVILLICLYVLQGIPLGLSGAVPYMLMTRHVSYSEQATFSFASWPYSLKLLWAPLVDSLYSVRWGRRKCWLVPVQYLMAVTMLAMSSHVDTWLGEPVTLTTNNHTNTSSSNGSTGEMNTSVNLMPLTLCFFWLTFLAATQDIVVDGWALTMLTRPSIGWASTCNAFGLTLGYCISFMLFLALESKDFCNRWIFAQPQSHGLVTFSSFMFVWGLIFLVCSTIVLFKSEGTSSSPRPAQQEHQSQTQPSLIVGTGASGLVLEVTEEDSPDSIRCKDATPPPPSIGPEESGELCEDGLDLWTTYCMLWRIIRLRPVQQLLLTMLLIRIGSSAPDKLCTLKLIERGVPKESLALLGVFFVPLQLALPLILSQYVTGAKPYSIYMRAAMPRVLYGVIWIAVVFYTPYFQLQDKTFPLYYFVSIVALSSVQQVFMYTMFVSLMAFQARISDPLVGGTYMTLLNTGANLAGSVPGTVIMYLVDPLSKKTCDAGPYNGQSCLSPADLEKCTKGGQGTCVTEIEGFYVLTVLCSLGGVLAILTRWKVAHHMELLPLKEWHISSSVEKEKKA